MTSTMFRALRAAWVISAVLVFVGSARVAEASRFGLNGLSDGGVIVDIDGADARTSSTTCSEVDPLHKCVTAGNIASSPFDLITTLSVVSGGDPSATTLNLQYLSLVFTAPASPVIPCAVGVVCDTVGHYYDTLGHWPTPPAPAEVASSLFQLFLLPIDLGTFSTTGFALGSSTPLHLTSASQTFLSTLSIPLNSIRFGFDFRYLNPRSPNPFFDLSIAEPGAAAAVPEPASMLLVGSGLALVARRRAIRRG